MRRTTPTIRTWAGSATGAVLLGIAAAGWAAVPVEELGSDSRQVAEPTQQQPADNRGTNMAQDGVSELFYQLQVLQQQVQELRGMVEEQNHRLERLARDQQEQYLDLDRRMQALRSGGAGGSEPDAPQDGGVGFDTTPSTPSGGGASTERDAYTTAFELMKQRQFDQSARAFEQLIQEYPNGAYTPNAFYWLGELHLAQDDNEAARQAFAQVVNLYPDHQKVPDALYKLGVAYHRLGDMQRAREYLNRVRSEYPQSSAAGLAQTYLAEL